MKLQSLRAWWIWLKGIGSLPPERKYADECCHRPRLRDEEFLARYYSSSDIRKDIPLRVRKILAEQLGFDKVVPSDCPSDILQDIDLQDILDEIAEEFGVVLTVEELPNDDWSVDAIIRLVDSKFV
jgi:acyl carrier protein